jgi:hypothetical protein
MQRYFSEYPTTNAGCVGGFCKAAKESEDYRNGEAEKVLVMTLVSARRPEML